MSLNGLEDKGKCYILPEARGGSMNWKMTDFSALNYIIALVISVIVEVSLLFGGYNKEHALIISFILCFSLLILFEINSLKNQKEVKRNDKRHRIVG